MTTTIQGTHSGTDGASELPQVLIITDMPYQALQLQRLLGDMGREATLALGEEDGLGYLNAASYDTVILDVDLGDQVVGELARQLRHDHPASELAIMVGWWDARTSDMQAYSDLLIYKPVHPQQLRETFDSHVR